MKKNKIFCFSLLFVLLCGWLWPVEEAQAAGDDFNNIVHHIEAAYHVHRNYRFLMGFAGFVVKVSSLGGAKDFKMAIFENQHLFASEPDARLDEIMQSAAESGWQPLVRSFSRRSGEHNYIYAQPRSKDLRLLIVNVEPDEAVFIQVKINPDRLSEFINDNTKKPGVRVVR
jgi:hypothetical protein